MREFSNRGINFTFVKINEACEKMIGVMKENYKGLNDRLLTVTDLANACKTKTSQEVSKDFISAASFIISAHVSDSLKGKKSVGKKSASAKKEALWDTSKFETGQWFSQTTYV